MSDSGNKLTVTDLRYSRGGNILCEGLSFTLAPGELKVIRGANGSGKSTLLQILAGLRKPDSGQICWAGGAITEHENYPNLVCYIGHKHGMRPALSVFDNLRFWARMAGGELLLGAALNFFDLESLADTPFEALSAGWKQRVHLARLIISPAPLWLLDEPSSNLDAHATELLQSLLATRLERGGMIVMASHARIEGRTEQGSIDLDPVSPHTMSGAV